MTDPKDKTEELLAVLDLPEDEHLNWCINNIEGFYGDGADTFYKGEYCLSLADLAFRLRDEAGYKFEDAMRIVCRQVTHNDKVWISRYLGVWGICFAKPIHFIIAALIAKEKT